MSPPPRPGGETLGRPAALDEDQAADIVDAYAKGASVKALARQYDIAPHTVRRMLDVVGVRDTDVPEPLDGASTDVATEVLEQEPELLHTIDVPGLLAAHLKATQDAEILDALRAVRTIRAGRATRYESPPRSRSTRPC
ncbi:helix-turn-helix domain-containing protein [Streptomyces sp. SID8014]|nr:helix-turn-helix domain-containing protein [Streptomyces sp. SID8014]